MITKATFKCDQCSAIKRTRIPNRRGGCIPIGWFTMRGRGFSVDVCSEKCRRDFVMSHRLGILDDDEQPDFPRMLGPFRLFSKVPLGGKEILASLEEAERELEAQEKTETLDELAKEFKMPVEVVEDFYQHIGDTPCPKCSAESKERCSAMDGDEVRECPNHGPELKATAHSERVEAARATWRRKTQ